ncbi:hypothetical protein NL676_032648 [Syzygium grande]|nr:hypothetical protein NL676_032648 [Syzygium grande]
MQQSQHRRRMVHTSHRSGAPEDEELKEIDRDLVLKKPKLDKEAVHVAVPVDFLAPLPPCSPVEVVDGDRAARARANRRQFWKAGDYEGESNRDVLASRDGTHCVFRTCRFANEIVFACMDTVFQRG